MIFLPKNLVTCIINIHIILEYLTNLILKLYSLTVLELIALIPSSIVPYLNLCTLTLYAVSLQLQTLSLFR